MRAFASAENARNVTASLSERPVRCRVTGSGTKSDEYVSDHITCVSGKDSPDMCVSDGRMPDGCGRSHAERSVARAATTNSARFMSYALGMTALRREASTP